MKKLENSDTVKIHYTGKLEDGTEFDSSVKREPLEFTMGAQQVIRGLEAGIIGMGIGDSKTVNIPFEDAYGSYSKENIYEFDRAQIPADLTLEKGLKLQMSSESGQIVIVKVIDFNDDKVKLDANHELAGKNLIFDVEIVDIIKNQN